MKTKRFSTTLFCENCNKKERHEGETEKELETNVKKAGWDWGDTKPFTDYCKKHNRRRRQKEKRSKTTFKKLGRTGRTLDESKSKQERI